jgi:ABC-type Fe3+ transport system substrate-binding protein
LVGVLAALPACGSSGQRNANSAPKEDLTGSALVSAAEAEGHVTFYTSVNATSADKLAAAFEKAYPKIKVDSFKSTGSGVYETLLADAARRQVRADVVNLSSLADVIGARDAEVLAKYVPADDVMKGVKPINRIGEPYGDPMYTEAAVWLYRTDLSPNALKAFEAGDYAMFDDPAIVNELRGNVVMVDPSLSGASMQELISLNQSFGDDKLKTVLTSIAQTKPIINTSTGPSVDSVSSGERKAAFVNEHFALAAAKKNAKLRYSYLNPTPTFASMMSVTSGAPHPNAARLFETWVASADGQKEIQDIFTTPSIRTDVPDERGLDKLPWYSASLFNQDWIVPIKQDYVEKVDTEKLLGNFADIMSGKKK